MTYQKGQIVYVDLNNTNGTDGAEVVKRYSYSDDFLKSYLGGRGFNSAIMYRLRAQTLSAKAYDPSNLVLISAGLFAGTDWPSSGRTTVSVLKSPVTGMFGDGNLGGHFGPALRNAHIDCLIIDGKASTPLYLYIDQNGKISLYAYPGLPKLGTIILDAFLKNRHGSNIKSLVIGPGGWNRVFSAVTSCDGRTAGGGGAGAVLGSKNVGAIVVGNYDQDKSIEPYSSEFKTTCKAAEEQIRTHPVFKSFSKYGTTSLVEIHSAMKYYPSLNWTKAAWKAWKKVSAISVEKYLNRHFSHDLDNEEELAERGLLGCRNCPIVCSNVRKLEYETLNCLGAKIGIENLSTIDYLNTVYFVDAGLDVIQTTSVISAIMQMSEDGVIDFEMKWGDREAIVSFIRGMMHPTTEPLSIGKHFCDGFEEGLKRAVEEGDIIIDDHYTIETLVRKYFVSTKGMGLSGVFPSSKNKGVALAVATSTRGADHLRSLPTLATYASWYFGSLRGLVRKVAGVVRMPLQAMKVMKGDAKFLVSFDLYAMYNIQFGVPQSITHKWKKSGFLENPKQNKGWGMMIKFTQEMYALSDAVSMCRFTSPWRFGVGPSYVATGASFLTGIDFTDTDVMRVGERINVMERILIYVAKNKFDDTVSERFLSGRGSLDKHDFDELLEDYYSECGYSRSGYPVTIYELISDTVDTNDLRMFSELKQYREEKFSVDKNSTDFDGSRSSKSSPVYP